MDIRKIKQLIELFQESGIGELEVSEGGESIRINGFNNTVTLQTPEHIFTPTPIEAKADTEPELATEKTTISNSDHNILSPMVGTFYCAPSPDAAPFVTIGQTVKSGDTICLVEAMKMMNQIKSDKAGIITDILVQDGQTVEFDQPIVIIE
ncbi:acetyl-CoA carboxylase biotin carboxyl carrier protein [Vibrio sp.]|uniref:Biotin carboxyl carrier protein of acetyl-CoA carboxylase n=1 Tax=Vibrio viridaestus TaxID=2487322 RepID=A0A3N9TAP9_9VIBR|nr:acetyl-CoA carboxylase biotin carboxyl carrier protein [Vibrio viridaestus]MDC0611562.1 acetyl-CoA carboxylase biotin carboxyl carrier protein [Vibrio sp.]RQW61201.1 acetyl-CoA carboxylase biotin carboxyl carrier protein [Vibrio viridaestus]